MSPNKLSKSIKDELNALAFKGRPRDFKDMFLEHSVSEIREMISDDKQLHDALENLALNERADFFRIVLFKFGEDEGALQAILKGFRADERFNSGSESPYGVQHDAQDLEAKRAALREFSAQLTKKQPSQSRQRPRHPRDL